MDDIISRRHHSSNIFNFFLAVFKRVDHGFIKRESCKQLIIQIPSLVPSKQSSLPFLLQFFWPLMGFSPVLRFLSFQIVQKSKSQTQKQMQWSRQPVSI